MENDKEKSNKPDECVQIKILGTSETLELKNAKINGNTIVLEGPEYSIENECLKINKKTN